MMIDNPTQVQMLHPAGRKTGWFLSGRSPAPQDELGIEGRSEGRPVAVGRLQRPARRTDGRSGRTGRTPKGVGVRVDGKSSVSIYSRNGGSKVDWHGGPLHGVFEKSLGGK